MKPLQEQQGFSVHKADIITAKPATTTGLQLLETSNPTRTGLISGRG